MITYMELRAGEIVRPDDKAVLDMVLAMFIVFPIDWDISERAIAIRGTSLVTPPKIKLPDAIIGATAARWGLAVVTRNPRDFAALSIPVHVPYTYDSTSGTVSHIRKPYAATSRFTRLK